MGDIPQLLTLALTSRAPKVIDADAITHLGDPERLKGQDAVITPHEGEFRKLFDIASLRLHPLTGDRQGQYALTLTGRWRLILTVAGDTAIIEEVSSHYGD